MPNWVNHQLTVRGSRATLTAFRRANRAPDVSYDESNLPAPLKRPGTATPDWRPFSFAGAVPVPAEIQAQPYDPIGYRWQIDHWGTKWDASDVGIVRRGEQLRVTFSTPWGAPLPWFRALIAAWPTLDFTWWAIEEQPAFCFLITATGGQITHEQEWVSRLESLTTPLTADELTALWPCPFLADLAPSLLRHPVVLTTARGRRWARQAVASSDWYRARLLGHLTRIATGRQRRAWWLQGLAAAQAPDGFGESEPLEWLDALLSDPGARRDPSDAAPEAADAGDGGATLDPAWMAGAKALQPADQRALLRALLLSPYRELRTAGTQLTGALGTLRPRRPRSAPTLAGTGV